MFFKHFAGKNQLPRLYISETLVENGLNITLYNMAIFKMASQIFDMKASIEKQMCRYLEIEASYLS